MAYVVNSYKVQARDSALGQADLARTRVSGLASRVNGLLAQLDYAVGGAPSGIDRELIGQCQLAASCLSSALNQLCSAGSAIAGLDVTEWVPDEPYYMENGGLR